MKAKVERRKAEGQSLVCSRLPGAVTRRKAEGKMLELFDQLTSEQQDKLIAFVEFLTASASGETVAGPLAIPRPAAETVTMAIRRLVRTYPMLDRRRLMAESSHFMAQHALQGRPTVEVIDELEVLFSTSYQQYKSKVGSRKAKG